MSFSIHQEGTLRQCMEIIDRNSRGILFVLNEEEKLIGAISDGDIRRALLKGATLDSKIENWFNRHPIYVTKDKAFCEIKSILIMQGIRQLPIVDENMHIFSIVSIEDVVKTEAKDNYAVIMAGGLGTRLRPLTDDFPKPMLKVGKKPILELIITNLKKFGFENILLCINYKAEIIKNYFQDGTAFGVQIEYIEEKERLGTAGALNLAKFYLKKPFIVTNGDILTNINYSKMLSYHLANEFDMTVGARKHQIQVPYGVLQVNGKIIEMIEEKPEITFHINGGIYVLNPAVLELIPESGYFDMTSLINQCTNQKKTVGFYRINDYWLDIGQLNDYYKANNDIKTVI